MEQVNIGIIGFGTVGAGTFEALTENSGIIADRVGARVTVKKVADLDTVTDRGITPAPGVLTADAQEILDDPDIDVIVELIGGLGKAKEYILAAMDRGKHVVTANKALLAEFGREIYEAAEKNGVSLGFEASVGGGIPIISAMKYGLSANRIQTMMGILNGTSNYILTRMTQEGLTYDSVVREAVELGFAEDPPTLDVDGTDAAHKLAILISLAFGVPVSFKAIYREGIDSLTPDDIRFAGEFGYEVKLLAIARDLGDRLEARVHPTMIPKGHILANVREAYNAIYLVGDFVGPNLYYGLGAGRRPTGSAVVSDIVSLVRHVKTESKGPIPPLGYVRSPEKQIFVNPIQELETAYYFRFSALDRPGVLSKISGILGENRISISSVIQEGREVAGSVPLIMLTHEAQEKDVQKAISSIDELEVLTDKTVLIRVES